MPGTVLLLAASPVGKGCLVDAASVLPVLAAVPPAVLSGTETANVVELADPLEPQAVLTRLRAAATAPGPLTVFVTGQLLLDRRQHLPHLALARTTTSTVRYTAFPWHWLREELRLRAPGTTALLLDLHADAETWTWLRGNVLDCGRNNAVYGRIAPPPSRRTVAVPTYMKAVATILRSGRRPGLAELHQQALARLGSDGYGDLVLTSPGAGVAAVPGGSVPSPPYRPERPRPHTPDGLDTANRNDEGDARRRSERAVPREGEDDARRERAGSARWRGENDIPRPGEDDARRRGEDDARSDDDGGGRRHGGDGLPRPGEGDVPRPGEDDARRRGEDDARSDDDGGGRRHGGDGLPRPGEGDVPRPGERDTRHRSEGEAAHRGVGDARRRGGGDRRRSEREVRWREDDPHAYITAAVQDGRHQDADALAAEHERAAVRAHGPGSEHALHWAEVRADLAMFAGDPVRSCRTWLAVAGARLTAGQAPDSPAVEAAVDRAHHQWGQIREPGPARELGRVLAEVRGRVPGRRQGALENVHRQLRQLQTQS
ncbi:hypothetical protein [Streptomyces sp. ALI-76-A]|uniref:hypothetical protein n=1 Tax=Streptomyces sp. ALI-76-A TaxID=3025736 RepID=UPI00256EDEE0|nr:hypothetical protein [Streptomyces sp. ALI-76-A]MDL5202730.1 hypothetical protein [Streptomyces sp. ALI-76-A]